MIKKIIFLCSFFVLLPPVFAQQRMPKIGYIYPAGGQRGTTFHVLIGGRQIARSTDVIFSGSGVSGRIIHGYGSMSINDGDHFRLARYLFDKRRFKLGLIEKEPELPASTAGQPLPPESEVINRYPYFDRIEHATQEDLQLIYYTHFMPRPDPRPGEAINQGVWAEITVDSHTEPGSRELRLLSGNGLSAPARFMVGTVPEIREIEPNDPNADPQKPFEFVGRQPNFMVFSVKQLPVQELPAVFNGQIFRGDVDKFAFNAKKGQKLVVGVRARYLVPYLADGVPGWFQSVVSIYDSEGGKVGEAFAYRFDPDPVILFEVPKDGVYSLEIQDTVYRGRADFVYRITIDESPFITSVFPLGGTAGKAVTVDIHGWNLPANVVTLKTGEAGNTASGSLELTKIGKTLLPYPLRYAVNHLPETLEKEPNNSVSSAQDVKMPVIINGRIDSPTDIDYFSFKGKKGSRVVLDITARALNSPLDASIELLDSDGKVIAANDDRADNNGPNIGLETHHADPYLLTELPADGVYTVRLFNTLRQGGAEYGYQLRISPPQPDFAVYCEPSSICFTGKTQMLKLFAVRKDGFDGAIQLSLEKTSGAKGFFLDGAKIPKGQDKLTATITATPEYNGSPAEIVLEAVAETNGKELRRTAVPVDDWEQAFIYHHFVPSASLTVLGMKGRQGNFYGSLRPESKAPVQLKHEGITEIHLLLPEPARRAGGREFLKRVDFVLQEPSAGFSMEESKFVGDQLVLKIKGSKTEEKIPDDGNLIIGIRFQTDTKKTDKVPVGVLPAIPYRLKTI